MSTMPGSISIRRIRARAPTASTPRTISASRRRGAKAPRRRLAEIVLGVDAVGARARMRRIDMLPGIVDIGAETAGKAKDHHRGRIIRADRHGLSPTRIRCWHG